MTLELTVPNMACADCAEKITEAIAVIDATAQVTADPKTKKVNVDTQATESAIKAAILGAGYTVG